jgi:hypothetical protein
VKKSCRTCAHWQPPQMKWAVMTSPIDPDTSEPMAFNFEVRECKHPQLLFCERPLEANGFAVADGSYYYAGLFTAQDFGCVRHEAVRE